MAANLRNIVADLFTALRVDHTLTGGSYDLSTSSGTPKVLWADEGLLVDRAPLVVIGGLSVETSYDDGASLGEYTNTGRLEWWAFVAVNSVAAEDRALAAVDLANDIITAVQNAHQDPSYTYLYTVTKLLVTLEDVFGDALDAPATMAAARGRIDFVTTSVRGI
jgi:hypothetical protein